MTLSSDVSRAEYNGDGATTVFSTVFQFFANDDVKVYLRDAAGTETLWTEGTEYTLTGALTGGAGNVTVDTSPTDYTPAVGEVLVILRTPDETQETDFPLGGPFPSTAAEQAIDRVVMLIQALREELNRTPKLSVTSLASGVVIPDPENGTILGWESGQLANFSPNTDAYIGLPLSSTNGAIVTWNGVSGNALADSGIIPGTAAGRNIGTGNGEVPTFDANGSLSGFAFLGHLHGLTLSNNATDATNDIDIAAGEAVSTEINPVLMKLSSGITKRLDAAWAVGAGNGGLDTGTIADTTYHVWLIQRSDTGVVDVLFSASATSPTMPASYDRKRRIGSIVRQSGAIRAFLQDGDNFWWEVPAANPSVTNPGGAPVNRTLTVPLGLQVIAKLNVVIRSDSASAAVYLSDLDLPATAPDQFGVFSIIANSAASVASGQVEVRTSVTGEIRSEFDASGANTFLRIATAGWVDTRGRI